jgi:acyl-[acyl-carrier-protein]-phospholipid O-acyltransferase/long-chain-fatty-acid--[acyl-carrier-protein] ligase
MAGAEMVKEGTRRLWADRFGVRVLEGYGATECAPVLALTTPSEPILGTVGRLVPALEGKLESVPGVDGQKLWVRGPNVMAGYLRIENPGILDAPEGGWYDTGDIVQRDEHGRIKIVGRAKRFAKVGGEMVSLSAVENFAAEVWPNAQVAAVNRPHPRTGEHVLLAIAGITADKNELSQRAKEKGIANIMLPSTILNMDDIPMLASGKTDYPNLLKTMTEMGH